MCYLVAERYSVCRCLYYKHPIQMCAAYGQQGHPIQERTVLVGYACEQHSKDRELQASSSRVKYSDSGYGTANHGSARRPTRRTAILPPPASPNIELKDGVDLRSEDNVSTRKNTPKTSPKEGREVYRSNSKKRKSGEELENEVGLPEPEKGKPGAVPENLSPKTAEVNDGGDPSNQASMWDKVDSLLIPDFESGFQELESNSKITDNSIYLLSLRSQKTADETTYLDPLRSRLLDSKAYFTSLSELEEIIWLNSSLSNRKPEASISYSASAIWREMVSYVSYPEISNHLLEHSLDLPEPLSDDDVDYLCVKAACSALSLLRECRNIVMRTYLNLRRLKLTGFCGTQFSIIVADSQRQSVASLLMVNNADIIELLKFLESWLRNSARKISDLEAIPDYTVAQQIVNEIDAIHMDWLLSRDIFRRLCGTHVPPGRSTLYMVWLYVSMLDVGVVSYAGAHLNDIASPFYLKDEFGIHLKSRLFQSEVDAQFFVTASRCHLQCLDEFHDDKPVWVFSPNTWSPNDHLYLSTSMIAFADIWGPLWKAIDQKEPRPDTYAAYIVGNGTIHPWKHDQRTDPPLEEKEVFCHWVSDEALDEDMTPPLSSNIDQRPFNGLETLLIGAATSLEVTALDVNNKCRFSISKARQHLRDMGRLCILGAARPYLYNDGSQYQLQVGYSGVNASATKQYKRNAGQTLKKVLVELWSMEPGLRDPQILMDFHGVEVSPCTHNAQRVSLAYLLGLNCMRSLLSGFNWKSEQYKTDHFETLKNICREPRKLEAEFREQFEEAVMLCLRMLSKTGVDRKDNLSVFLASSCTPKPELATLVSAEHSWIGLLKDTTTDCAMAAFGDQCLESKHNAGATCGGIGRTAFLTAIVRNGLAKPLQLERFFSLGERGVLRLKYDLENGVLVTEWHPARGMIALKMLVGKEHPHREYTEIDQSGEENVTLFPVIVLSDRQRIVVKERTVFTKAR